MTAPAAGSGPGRSPLAAGWGIASLGGIVAFGVLAALAVTAALAVYALGLPGLGLGDAFRVGGLYLALFHRVPIRFSAAGSGVGGLVDAPIGSGLAELHAEVAFAPLAATALAAWLLWRAGRTVAASLGGSPLERALHGAKIAPAYALAVFGVSLVSHVEVSRVDVITPGVLDVHASPLHAFVLPLALAVLAGAGGGWWSGSTGPESRRLRGMLAGGWTMLVAGIGLAYAGLVVAGIVRPDGLEALLTPTTGMYYQDVFDRPSVGAVVLGHHFAVAPNEGVWALTPAMGGCLGVFPVSDVADPFLCYRRFPRETPLGLPPPSAWARPSDWLRFGDAPVAYLLFLIAPGAAAVAGGWRAVSAAGGAQGSVRRAVVLGAGAGVVFAALLAVASWAGSISAWASLTVGLATDQGAVRIGPDLRATVLLSLVWGVLGGAVGAAFRTAGLRRSEAPPTPHPPG
ncbi:MAG TPA: hypothetical protein VLE71_01900 [Actinomycetota bacterium]|nr:hypothetical protein [Actinomycetota bacterium]